MISDPIFWAVVGCHVGWFAGWVWLVYRLGRRR